jgi:hypothetical protein
MNFDDFKLYLPKYLSADSEKELFEGLKNFPTNIDARLYTTYLKDEEIIYQGDGIKEMLVINLPTIEAKPVNSMIISNTCDIDLANKRMFSSNIIYCPIIKLSKYQDLLKSKSGKTEKQINSHITAIKNQEITQVFFLPNGNGIIEESIVFLDRINHISNDYISREKLSNDRIFTLSDYGAYLFLLKLSIHFTRIQDKVERKSINL